MAASKNVESVYGLTPLQEGILFHSLQSTDPGVYLGQYSVTLRGSLEPDRLRDAWQQATMRHATLRTLFAWRRQEKRPLQVVRERVAVPWEFENWETLNADAQIEKWQLLFDKERAKGFELDKAPLFRLVLIRVAPDEHRFLFSYHHLLFDGWSLRLLLDEVAKIYTANAKNEALDLNPPGSFEDYVHWLDSRDWQNADRYWAERLKDFDSPARLQLPGPDPGHDDYPFGFRATARVLAPELLSSLEQFAREQRLTLSTIFTGAWSLLLARYADRDDVVFGSAQAGRPAELERAQQTVGLFINTIVVRVQVQHDRTLGDWLRSLQQEQLKAQEFQHFPLAKAQKVSGVPAGKPLFESLLVYQGVPATAIDDHPWQSDNESFLEYGNYPLALLARPGIPFMLTAVHDLTKIETSAVERLLGHFEQLLHNFVQDPDTLVGEIDLLPSAERRLLLQGWSGAPDNSGGDSPRSKTPDDSLAGDSDFQPVHTAIELAGRNTPDAIALEQGEERVTYADLLDRADHLANLMQQRGLASGGFGAVLLNRSPDAVIAMLAVLKTGAAYVPLDPAYPPIRIEVMLQELAEEAGRQGNQLLVVTETDFVEPLQNSAFDMLTLTEWAASPIDQSMTTRENAPGSLAYVMYTSGSTGHPKGVLVSHRNLSASTKARSIHYPEPPGKFLLLSSLASDSSIAGLFWSLSIGATLVLPRVRQEQVLNDIVDIIRNHKVTHLLTLPSLYAMLLEHAQGEDLNALRCAIVAGEACHKNVVEAHRRQLPDVPLYNEYGPSEASVWSTHARLDINPVQDHVPIGRPITGWQLYVLDSQRRLVPQGLPGELCVGGAGVSQGYLARQELSQERFITQNFGDGDTAQLYRTGDRGRFLSDGQLAFIGRVDNQLKVRGYRVEPEEIEQVLCTHPAIREAAVVLVPSDKTCSAESSEQAPASRLVAFVGGQNEAPSGSSLRDYLRARLPEHMVPNAFVSLDVLPRTALGKVDSTALRALAIPDASTAHYVAPRNDTEKTLVDIWQTVLDLSRVGIHDNFFEIGGDSLRSIRLLARANRSGYEISPSDFIEHPTIAEQALLIKPATSSTKSKPGESASQQPPASDPFSLVNLDSAGFASIAQQLDDSDDKRSEPSMQDSEDSGVPARDSIRTVAEQPSDAEVIKLANNSSPIPERISAAIHLQRLAQVSEIIAAGPEVLSAEDADLIEAARQVGGNIRDQLISEANSLVSTLQSASIPCDFDASSPELVAPQFHRFSVSLRVDDPTPAVELLRSLKFWSATSTKDIHWESFRRSHNEISLTRIDDASTRLDLSWRTQSDAIPWRPGPGFLLRHPGRVARAAWVRLSRLGGQSGIPADHFLGDLLSTPRSLIQPLLDFAGVNGDDTLVDVGCGDGRMLIEAALTRNCRGIGFESQKALCKIAREQIGRAQLGDRVTIHNGDAWSAPLNDATVVFLFVPVRALSVYLPQLLERLAVGTRIVVHEQVALDSTLKPDLSAPLISDAAVSVAHLWQVR